MNVVDLSASRRSSDTDGGDVDELRESLGMSQEISNAHRARLVWKGARLKSHSITAGTRTSPCGVENPHVASDSTSGICGSVSCHHPTCLFGGMAAGDEGKFGRMAE